MKKILLPVDGSTGCQKALDIAEDMAKKFDSTITVFNVYFYLNTQTADGFVIEESKVKNVDVNREIAEKTAEYFKSRGVKAETKVVTGDPAIDIIDEAEKGSYDLVILCTHGMSANRRFLIGSVTNKVVHHIKVPVLIVR